MAKHSKFYIHFCKVLKICRIPQIKNFSPTFFGLFCQSSYYSYISSQKVLRCFLKCFSMVPYLDFFSGRHMGQHQTFSMHFLSPQDINPQRVQFNGWYTIKAEKEGQTVIVFSYKLNLSIARLKNRALFKLLKNEFLLQWLEVSWAKRNLAHRTIYPFFSHDA